LTTNAPADWGSAGAHEPTLISTNQKNEHHTDWNMLRRPNAPKRSNVTPEVNIYETKDGYTLEAEMPA